MKLNVTKRQMPSVEELFEVLNNQYSTTYTVKRFGIGGKAIMIRKSAFVAVRIFMQPKKNRLLIMGAFGSIWIQALLGGLLIIAFVYSSWKKMENETYQFLESQY